MSEAQTIGKTQPRFSELAGKNSHAVVADAADPMDMSPLVSAMGVDQQERGDARQGSENQQYGQAAFFWRSHASDRLPGQVEGDGKPHPRARGRVVVTASIIDTIDANAGGDKRRKQPAKNPTLGLPGAARSTRGC
jgi:hypothetical protein